MSTKQSRPGSGVRGISVKAIGHRRWDIVVFAGYHGDGKANRAHLRVRGSRAEAIDAGIAKKQEMLKASYDPNRYTVGSWFEDAWLPYKRAQVDRDDRSPHTVDKYSRNFRLYIAPFAIAHVKLVQLDDPKVGPAALIKWFTDLSSTGGKRRKQLSPKTLQHALAVMHSALEHACKAGPLNLDPFRRFPDELRPRPRDNRPSERSLGSKGQRAIREAFRGHKLEGQVELALLGLRVGEILGLRTKSDEDPENGDVVLDDPCPLVRVRQVAIRVDGEGARIRSVPKTDMSIRDVPLPKSAIPVLRAAKVRALKARVAAGAKWEEHHLLFPSTGQPASLARAHGKGDVPGRPMHPSVFSLAFKKRLTQVGLGGFDIRRVSPHALRHTFVSVLVNEAGMRAEDVQFLAGHADLRTTQRYRARDNSPGVAAARALDELWTKPSNAG